MHAGQYLHMHNHVMNWCSYQYHKLSIFYLPVLEGGSHSRCGQHPSMFFCSALASNPALRQCFPLEYSLNIYSVYPSALQRPHQNHATEESLDHGLELVEYLGLGTYLCHHKMINKYKLLLVIVNKYSWNLPMKSFLNTEFWGCVWLTSAYSTLSVLGTMFVLTLVSGPISK